MKKLAIVLAAIFFLAGCAVTKPQERRVYTSFADYRAYSSDGFLISPSPYTYNFESVGELEISVYPAKVVQEVKYSETYIVNDIRNEAIDYNELVAIAVKEAKAKGADAIVNFAINVEYTYSYNKYGYTTAGNISKYIIKGFCIKRL